MERDEPQISFRVKEERQRTDFADALAKQPHVSSQAAFFTSVMQAVKTASDAGKLIEWPVSLVTKKGQASAITRGIVITDPKGRVTYVDAEFTKMCGYTLHDLIGKTPGSILQGPATEQKIVRSFHRAIAAQRPFECVMTNYDSNQNLYRVHIEMNPIIGSDRKLTGFHALEQRVN